MALAGLPVPPGFILTTGAYWAFLEANQLAPRIAALLPPDASADPQVLEQASAQIRALFSAAALPPHLSAALLEAYAGLGEGPVAVRSSATAEDLPDLSFAGQQDTYLNILGGAQLLKAVVDCWSSLWTARAIGYRARNRIEHAGVALAVVVQRMVESQASGVLFTANPLTGLRSETVIDATLGLGEALVSGKVEPDHYVVDPAAGRIVSRSLGAKVVSIHGQAGGGTFEVQQPRAEQQALPDEQILALAGLAQQAAGLYGTPQDIEWAWAGGRLFLLQSRPITSLFPLPEGVPPEPLKVWFSFGAVQGMLDPVTPLGRDVMRALFTVMRTLFGIHDTPDKKDILFVAGERIWINVTTPLRNSVGRKVMHTALSMVEPGARQAIEQIWDDPRLQPERPGVSFHARTQIARFFIPLAGMVLRNFAAPGARRRQVVQKGEELLVQLDLRSTAITGSPREKLARLLDIFSEVLEGSLPRAFPQFVSLVVAGMASWNFLDMLSRDIPEEEGSAGDLVLKITRGMPYNPTTEMDLALWQMAKTLRADPPSLQAITGSDSAALSAAYLSGGLPVVLREVVGAFLEKYGGRGLGEIDMGRPRWADEPAHVFEMVGSFVQIEDETKAPDVVFARSAETSRESVTSLARAVRKTRRGWLKAVLVRFFAGRARQLMGARESPKFFAVRMMYIVRRELLKVGRELARDGVLAQPDDLVYFSFAELRELAAGSAKDWRGLAAARRELNQRETLRRQIPRVLLSDGRAFYEGVNGGSGSGAISGSPVSPGSAQGRVRVVLDPRQARLLPGEILVCPGTDPSWTPLFLSAAGLVMEVGGMMTHGAVVAREYGIPAIVGVDRATTRLLTGQLIRVNGSSGEIEVLEEPVV
jgi:phosphohistidine swiveling domain-containing protein